MVTSTTEPPFFSVSRRPSSTALAAIGSSSWGTPLRTMRLLLGSISMVTVLAGMTLPHTTTFNISFPHEKLFRRQCDRGAFSIKAPLS
jgi:hypothetical protein